MRAATWNPDRTLLLTELRDPVAAPGEVIVRVAACGICGSDLHAFRGERKPAVGVVPGHEIAGFVAAGAGLAAETPVAIDPVLVCGDCLHCRGGAPQLCASRRLLGFGPGGGFQERVAVPARNVHVLPGAIDPVFGSMAEPVAVCVRAINLAELPSGARVLVLGAGAIGLISVLLARGAASEVAITARHPHQAEVAKRFGAVVLEPESAAYRAYLREHRPDVVIETVGGEATTLADAILAVRAGGTVVALGVFTGPSTIPAYRLVSDEVRLLGSMTYGISRGVQDFAAAVALLPRLRPDLELLRTHQFPLSQANEAFQAALDKRSGALKVTVLPGT